MPRFYSEELNDDEMLNLAENAGDFNATGVYDSNGTLVAIANTELASTIAVALDVADPPQSGQQLWLWA